MESLGKEVWKLYRQDIMQGVVQVCLYPKLVAEREHVIGKRLIRKRVVAVTLL